MDNEKYELLKEHIDLKFDTLKEIIQGKISEDKIRDEKISKIEKKMFAFVIILSAIFNGPDAIKSLLKGF